MMASVASLLMLLAVTFPIQAMPTYDAPDVFPQTKTEALHQLPDLEDIMNRFDDLCPPFGLPSERFNVEVLGSFSPPVGGCASMQTVHHDIIPAFNLWLGNVQNGGGSCDETDMDHYMFECLSKHPFVENDNIKGWFVILYDRTAKWTGQKDYKCGLYTMILDDPPTIKMAISANRTCDGLSQIMANDKHKVSEGLRHFQDGSVALLFTKDWPHPFSSSDVWRKKRSALKDDVYRFPDWSQGSWLDLQVDGSLIRYDTAFHEKDDDDYEQDSDYGKDENAEMFGGELYMQRSQRHDPVGISGRNRRSIPNMNGIKMLKTWITTIQNNTWNKFWLKHKLSNNMWNLDLSETQQFILDIFTKILTILVESPPDPFSYEDYTTKETPKNTTMDMNDNPLKISLDLNRSQYKRDLMNESDPTNEETKSRKKRYFENSAITTTAPYRDLDFENPPKVGDPVEPFDKTNKYFETTSSLDNRSNTKRMYTKYLGLFNLRRKRRSALPEKQKSFLDIFTELLPVLVESPPDLFGYQYYTTKKTPESKTTNVKDQSLKIPIDFNRFRYKRDLMNESGPTNEETKSRKKRCFENSATTTTAPYRDLDFENPPKVGDPVEPFDKTNKYFGTTPSPNGRTMRNIRSMNNLDNKSKNTNYEEEKILKKIKVKGQVNNIIRWWNIMRVLTMIEHHRWNQLNKYIKENEFKIFPDISMTPVPSPVKYLEFAKIHGIPYKEAVLKWQSFERKYRQREAEVNYTAYPGKNHPDIVMRDFDQKLDGIEYDLNPLYPEGTVDDPTAYRDLNLPGGYRIEPRLSHRTTFEKKQLGPASESATVDSYFQNVQLSSINGQKNTLKVNKRMRRSSTQHSQQQRATTKFTWRCIMPVDNDDKQLNSLEAGAKFLTYGGRIMEKTAENDNDQHNEPKSDTLFDIKEDSKMSYGCLWLVPRGPNIIEFAIIGTGLPDKYQDIKSFARQLCTEKKVVAKDSNIRNMKKLHPRRHSWVTETRADEGKRVAVGCPIPSGTVFYGEVPAPPPSSTITNNSQPAPTRLCVRLISSADDCTNGQAGPIDQMKYTVSECVERDSSTGTSPQTVAGEQTIFEASRGYAVGGNWRRNKRHSDPVDTSTAASTVTTTSTSSNTPMLPNHSTSTGSTATASTATTSSSITPDSSKGSQNFIDITTVDPTTFTTTTSTTTTTAAAFSTDKSSTLSLSSPQQTISLEQQLPSFTMSSIFTTTTTSPPPPPLFTSTATVTTTTTHYPTTDYYYRQQRQWQQQHPQTNHNNNDYYYQGRQQNYPPPPSGSTGTDYNYYYLQRQQQQWQHQNPQTPLYWSSQQHVNGANDRGNGYQQQTTNGGAHRTGDYYYRQQQQNYYNHQYDNDRQQQTLQPRNASLTVQHPSGGGWNVHGDRPLYISSGSGGSENNREIPVARNNSASVSSSNNGGWATPEQQHWWYQQQQQRQQEQQKQYQQRQQQNNRGLGGILSLPPVPLPPLHVEQGPVTVSMPTLPPLHLRRPQKPPDHYFLPTLTTKTTINHRYRLRPKSESRYYEEREYKCLGQWTEPQQHINQEADQKPIMLTFMYVKRLNPINNGTDQFECFVGTIIPNDEGANPETTTTLLLTEAGSRTLCSRRSDPYHSGMKLVGTKINKEGACKGSDQPAQDTAGSLWYPLKPQQISPSIPAAENSGGTWYAAPPVPVIAQSPTTMKPILTGRHTGGNGASFTSRQNERRPPPKTNKSIRTVSDKRIIIFLAFILFAENLNNIARHYFN